jgi:hypothetical protein
MKCQACQGSGRWKSVTHYGFWEGRPATFYQELPCPFCGGSRTAVMVFQEQPHTSDSTQPDHTPCKPPASSPE